MAVSAIAIASAIGGAAAATAITGATAGFVFAGVAALATLAISTIANSALGLNKKGSLPDFSSEARGRTQTVRSSVAPRYVVYGETVMSGPLIFATSTGDNNEFLHLVIPLADHESDSINSVFLAEDEIENGDIDGSGNVISGRYSGFVRIKKHLGTSTEAADSDLVSEVSEWTTDHRLRGITYVYLRLKYDTDTFPNGIPNIKAVVKGRKVFDPRTSTTVWSDNWALCVRDYIASTHGLSGTLNEASAIIAADISDESVSIPSGTQSRYTCNGAIRLDGKPASILQEIATAGAGAVVYTQGSYRIYAGAFTSSVASFDEDDLRGQLKVRPRVPRKELFNAVRGTYLSADNFWQASDFPIMSNATYKVQDNNETIYKDIELPYTDESFRAQRIAKIHLDKSRQGITVEFPAKLTALQVTPFDVIELSISRMGWTNKEFRVLGWQLSPLGGVDLTLQEEASASYDWDSGDATVVDPAPDTDLPNPFDVTPPDSLSIAEELYVANGTVKAKAIFSWETGGLRDQEYQAEFKLTTDSTFTVISITRNTSVEILDLVPGLYDFRVKAFNTLRVSSAFAQIQHEFVGLLSTPADVTGLTISKAGGLVILRWDQHPELDVNIGGKIVFRHSKATSGATWQDSVSIGEAIAGSESVAVMPLKPGTYLAKAEDSSGILSQNAVSVITNGAQILAFSNVDTVSEHPTFPGTHVNTVAIDDILKLQGTSLMDSWVDVDSIASWDTGDGGVTSSGTYTFASGIDLGSVQRSRLRTTLDVNVVNVNDLIDSRLDNIDTWEDFDGTQAASADCQVWVRETDDDPTGSPVWSAFERLDSAEYEARAFEFQARLSTGDSSYNIHVSELTVDVDQI